MAVLHSLLPQLGLFLCLVLYISSAFSASYNDRCMVFDKVFTSNNSGIKVEVFSGNYTVCVPVNNEVSSVVLRAVNQHNNSVGTWDGANEECNGTAVYNVTPSNSSFFRIHWRVPNSEDAMNTRLQVFIVDFNRTAAFSSVTMEQSLTPTAFTPTSKVSETNQTTTKPIAKTTTMATGKTTEKSTAKTTMATGKTTEKSTAKTTMATATSLAVRALSSPVVGAIHILLVFLISKLLF